MTCSVCGRPANGDRCADCRREQHQEDYFGVPSDHVDEEEGDDA